MVNLDLHSTSPHAQPLHALAAAGDAAAVATLLRREVPALRAYMRLLAGAAAYRREPPVDTLLALCRERLNSRTAGSFRAPDRFRAWWFAAVRQDSMRVSTTAVVAAAAPADDATEVYAIYTRVWPPGDGVALLDHGRQLECAFDALAPERAEILALVRVASVAHQLVAELLGRSPGYVRTEFGAALVQLRDIFET
jgi:DNA-directed RNA polymerase specialized sigma24 family protein